MLTTIQEIKKEFFSYRNGIIADGLRSNGDPHAYIMGCQLVDVIAIASRIQPSMDLAVELWNDIKHRECRMVAPMLFPMSSMTLDLAREWALSVETVEIADVLCHRLLRHLPFAEQLAYELVFKELDLVKYTGFRLLLNLSVLNRINDVTRLKNVVEKEKSAQPSRDIAQILISISEDL